MKRDISDTIRHYHVIPFLVYMIILSVIAPFLSVYIYNKIDGFFNSADSNVISIAVYVILFLAWAYPVFYITRETVYHDITGRNYGYDHGHYRRSYGELVDYFADADPYLLNAEDLPSEDWHESRGLIIGQTTINKERRLLKLSQDSGNGTNLLTLGLPGSGKTMAQIIPSGMKAHGSVLCWDLKGDIFHWTESARKSLGKKVKCFVPDDAEISCHFNPLHGIQGLDETGRRLFIEKMAFTLIPAETDAAGKYFTDGARDYWCGICNYLLNQNTNTTFSEIVRAILDGNVFDWTIQIQQSGIRAASDYTNGYIGSNEKNVSGIWSALTRAVRPFSSGSLAKILVSSDNEIHPEDLDDGNTDIYIIIPPQEVDVYAPIASLFVQQCMDFFLSRADRGVSEKISPITFLLDEVCQTTISAQTLSTFMALGRSKNCSCFLTAQSVMMIRQRFGDYADQVLDLCQVISCFSAQSPDSTAWLSKLFGKKKDLRQGNTETMSLGSSLSLSSQEVLVPVLQPEDFQNLNGYVAVLYFGKHILLERTNAYE